eukprot:CAMPEP_0176019692 /NCGR_PEP_ID=MMETSP0120_2-20121206/9520_1 /TAXON_ID=160619 /ORGANISM="Kryptoperidinium foliaceum, Strain CCMP 1326" /LENGTH=127 /DNA_ID=CAMNT_0017352773 /DNA_START=125 /DNA_END=509 /DNA_ORIENTATION=-
MSESDNLVRQLGELLAQWDLAEIKVDAAPLFLVLLHRIKKFCEWEPQARVPDEHRPAEGVIVHEALHRNDPCATDGPQPTEVREPRQQQGGIGVPQTATDQRRRADQDMFLEHLLGRMVKHGELRQC